MLNEEDFKFVIGKSINEAAEKLPQRYFIFVAQNDKDSFYRSMEYNPYRINVRVKNGYIYTVDGIN